ncbi:MAG: hypothetical protein M8857_00720, partial [marine benthic group bacterium]|nr:hypothetical protein [Gemmatimonadota bacterium]
IVIPTLLLASLVPVGSTVAQEASTDSEDFRLYHLMDAVDLRGEQVRLRVSMRSSDSTGSSRVFGWLQFDGPPVDGPGQEQRTAEVNSPEWSVEEVRAIVPGDAIDLLFGVGVEGSGPVWADDLQLAILKPSGVWRRLTIPNADFEAVAEGARPADWGGIDPGWNARIDHHYPYEGSSALRVERSAAGSGSR